MTIPDLDAGGFHFLGMDWPGPIFLTGSLCFGLIGFLAYQRALKAGLVPLKWIGLALMLYPYVIHKTLPMVACGLVLCGFAYAYRR